MNAAASFGALVRAIRDRGATLHLAELRDGVADELRKNLTEDDLGLVAPHRSIEQCLAAGQKRSVVDPGAPPVLSPG